MKKKSRLVIAFLIILSFVASYFLPGGTGDIIGENSLAFLGILFGIIIGFFLTDLYSRFQGIRDNAAIDSSCLSTYYAFAKILGRNKRNKKWLEKQKDLINRYIRKFMPLQWERYGETEKEFSTLVDSFGDVEYDSDKENETYSNMLSVISQHSDARERLVMYGKDKLATGEWLVILFLGGLLLWSLFYIKTAELLSILFTGAITSSILILLFVVKDLNNLNFGESAVSVEPYERVLDAIGKPRYFHQKGSFWKNLLKFKTRG